MTLPSEPQFAPADPTDGRAEGEFRTHYSRAAQAWIYVEGFYLAVLLAGAPLLLYLFWRGSLRSLLDLTPGQYRSAATWAEAWLGGLLGGTVLSIKWLYHSVARGLCMPTGGSGGSLPRIYPERWPSRCSRSLPQG